MASPSLGASLTPSGAAAGLLHQDRAGDLSPRQDLVEAQDSELAELLHPRPVAPEVKPIGLPVLLEEDGAQEALGPEGAHGMALPLELGEGPEALSYPLGEPLLDLGAEDREPPLFKSVPHLDLLPVHRVDGEGEPLQIAHQPVVKPLGFPEGLVQVPLLGLGEVLQLELVDYGAPQKPPFLRSPEGLPDALGLGGLGAHAPPHPTLAPGAGRMYPPMDMGGMIAPPRPLGVVKCS